MVKYLIVTSIFSPTEAIKRFSKLKDWQVVVVGDKETPKTYRVRNVIYLSPRRQLKLFPKVARVLPWNSYSRKNLGYLYAISQGADLIAESDDDNIPYKNWGKNISMEGEFDTVSANKFVNVYQYFTSDFVWPRGYPLNKILKSTRKKTRVRPQKIGVWQYLVDNHPDVDSIYRMIINKKITFHKRRPLVLEFKTASPFNTQNTFFRKELFPLLFLPPFVSMRFVDILRGLVAQPIMWCEGYRLGFASASAFQKRNRHNFLKDFELELPAYLYTEKIFNLATKSVNAKRTMTDNLLSVYKVLSKEGRVPKEVLNSLVLWLKEIKRYEKV